MSRKSSLRLLENIARLCLLVPLLTACHTEAPRPAASPPPTEAVKITGTGPVPQQIRFESLDRDPQTGAPVVLTGLLFKPVESDGRRRPAVIALHGCGGMFSTAQSKHDLLSLRHQKMAELLLEEGYAVLFPDSFRSRGFEEVCSVENRKRTLTQKHRRLDAQGALAWLQRRGDIQPERIAVLGWSHGGSAVLATLNAKHSAVAGWRNHEPAAPYFRAGAAFYPGCTESLKAMGGYSLSSPLTLFIGGSDDWTAPQPCIDLAAQLTSAGEDVAITVYQDAFHGFDGPASQPARHLNVPNGVNPGRGVTIAPNPAAREDAYEKLKLFLRKYLGS